MEDKSTLTIIICFWFLLTLVLTNMSNDAAIAELSYTGSGSFDDDADSYTFNADNNTGVNIEDIQATSWWGMIGLIFTFRITSAFAMPVLLATIISFINYLLLLMAFITLYKIVSPFKG